jgi:hypothetical protein
MTAPPTSRARTPAWVDSDTWYGFDGAKGYINVRTGALSATDPTGLRLDGSRRRSAALAGPWAVPFASPPPRLPCCLALPSSEEADADAFSPRVESWGGSSGPTFTAPHGVNLARDGHTEHLPEGFTSHLARAWAACTHGRAITWGSSAIEWCNAFRAPLQSASLAPVLARDPNYLTESECDTNPWVVALAAVATEARGLHVDVHGKRDAAGGADLDVGVGACRRLYGDVAADRVAAVLAAALGASLPGWTVDPHSRLQGCWRTVRRRSLTQSSAALGYAPVQLEIGYRLRRSLGRDWRMCERVAAAFAGCEAACVAACHGSCGQRAGTALLQPGS